MTPARPAIPAPSRGPWRLVIDVSGFNDGHLGRIEQTIEIEDGHFESSFRDGSLNASLEFQLEGERIVGHVVVAPGLEWQDVLFEFDGRLDGGVFARKLSGFSQVDAFAGRGVRDIDVQLRLER